MTAPQQVQSAKHYRHATSQCPNHKSSFDCPYYKPTSDTFIVMAFSSPDYPMTGHKTSLKANRPCRKGRPTNGRRPGGYCCTAAALLTLTTIRQGRPLPSLHTDKKNRSRWKKNPGRRHRSRRLLGWNGTINHSSRVGSGACWLCQYQQWARW